MSVEIYQKRHLEDLAVLFARLSAAIDDLHPNLSLSEAFREAVITHLEYHTGEKFDNLKFKKRYLEEFVRYRKEIAEHGLSILRP